MEALSVENNQENKSVGGESTTGIHDYDKYQGGGFVDSCLELVASERFKKFCVAVNQKKYSMRDADTTYRVINHWTKLGLFDDARPDDSMDWRKLSLKDIMWIRMARDLRKFGLPLDTLKLTYKSLWKRRYIGSKRVYPWMEVAMAWCQLRRQVILVVQEDGYAEITTPEGLALSDMLTGVPSLIRINVNNIWREVRGDKDGKYIPIQHAPFGLQPNEIDACAAMQETDDGAVTMHLKDGKITRIDTSKMVDGAERIGDILKETNFGEVTMKVENGKAVHTQMVKKEKPRA